MSDKIKVSIKETPIYGCANPEVINRTLMCDGDCNTCGYRIIERTYKVIE